MICFIFQLAFQTVPQMDVTQTQGAQNVWMGTHSQLIKNTASVGAFLELGFFAKLY